VYILRLCGEISGDDGEDIVGGGEGDGDMWVLGALNEVMMWRRSN